MILALYTMLVFHFNQPPKHHIAKLTFNVGMENHIQDEDASSLALHVKADVRFRYLLPNKMAKIYIGEQLPNLKFQDGKYTTYIGTTIFILSKYHPNHHR